MSVPRVSAQYRSGWVSECPKGFSSISFTEYSLDILDGAISRRCVLVCVARIRVSLC